MANSVVHFETFASDVERAREFYENVLSWTLESGGPPDFYHIVTGPGTDPGLRLGLLAKRKGPAAQDPLNGFRVTVSVKSVPDTMTIVALAGGKCAHRSSDGGRNPRHSNAMDQLALITRSK